MKLLERTSDQHRAADPPKQVIALSVVAGQASEPSVALTKSEKDVFKECEGILERGLGTFFEVGNALLRIRESRLYRDTHLTFERLPGAVEHRPLLRLPCHERRGTNEAAAL